MGRPSKAAFLDVEGVMEGFAKRELSSLSETKGFPLRH
jgi:hypothetical protein